MFKFQILSLAMDIFRLLSLLNVFAGLSVSLFMIVSASSLSASEVTSKDACSISCTFQSLSSNDRHGLGRIDFTNYNLIYIPRFSLVDNFTAVNLSHNALRSVPRGSFKNLSRLQVIDLSHNDIFIVHENAFGTDTGLQEIYLQNNRLAFISLSFFSQFPTLSLVDLDANTQLCLLCRDDCENQCQLLGVLRFSASLKENCGFKAKCKNHYFFNEMRCVANDNQGLTPSCFLTTEMPSMVRTTSTPSSTATLTSTVKAMFSRTEDAHESHATVTERTAPEERTPFEAEELQPTSNTMLTETDGSREKTDEGCEKQVLLKRNYSTLHVISSDYPKSNTRTIEISLDAYSNYMISFWILGGVGLFFNFLAGILFFFTFWSIKIVTFTD